jgi:diamine N-acetyltransferase
LNELSREHLAQLNTWRNDPEVVDLLGNNFLFIAGEVDSAWYDSYLNNRRTQVRLAITALDTGNHIGNVQLTDIHAVNRSAEFSILIGDRRYRNKGAGTYAMQEMLRHGFLDLNLNRIALTVLPHNVPAIALYQKCGFFQEGRDRQAIYKGGKYHDLLRMALLREDYLRQR